MDEHAGPSPHDIAPPPALPADVGAPQPKRQRSATECIHEIREFEALLDSGVVSQEEFNSLKTRLFRGAWLARCGLRVGASERQPKQEQMHSIPIATCAVRDPMGKPSLARAVVGVVVWVVVVI